MALPILETPTYELTLPSVDTKVKYRPFLVKEEKILLQALETGEAVQIAQSLVDIVKACTFGQLDGETMPTFDLEYVFLQIRAKSVGEIAKVNLLCPDDKKTYAPVEIDLTKVEVQVDKNHTNNIVIDKDRNLGIIMKYPTINAVSAESVKNMKTDKVFEMITNCIHEIYDGEKVHSVSDYTKDDLNKFIESLDRQSFNKMTEFFETMPQLKHEVDIVNPVTKVSTKLVLKGAQDFFVLPSHMTA